MNVLRKNPAGTLYSYAFIPACFLLFFILNSVSYGKGAPDSFSNLVERLSPSVVNITTSSTVRNRQELNPQLTPGSPFEDLFRDLWIESKTALLVGSEGAQLLDRVS